MPQAWVRFYGQIMTTQRMHLVEPSTDAEGIESIPTVIVGGGQAGLAMGYYLREAGEQFVILMPNCVSATFGSSGFVETLSPQYSSLPGWPMQPAASHPQRDG
jgi:hypothetical protein